MIAVYAKIAARSVGKGLVIGIVGVIFSVLTFWLSLYLFSNNANDGGGGHGGGLAAILMLFALFVEEFWTATLLFGSLLMIGFYVQLAFSSMMMTAVCGVWDAGLAGFVRNKVLGYLQRLKEMQSDWLRVQGDAVLLRARLLQQSKEDPDMNRAQRWALRYGFRKLQLTDVDLSDPHLDLPALVSDRMISKIGEAIMPSRWVFRGALLVQLLVALLAVIFDHK